MKKDKESFNKFFEARKNERDSARRQQVALFESACNRLNEEEVKNGYSCTYVCLRKEDVSKIMDTKMLGRCPKKVLLPEVRREVRKWGYKLRFKEVDKDDDIIFKMSIRCTPLRVLKLFLLSRGLL